ncbi:hypothetical protein [Acinetobacter sp.]|uniref:hypothetical protein n=1 Tax=Acinetobacter sp. TaxID=472 RepID=UPI00388E0658
MSTARNDITGSLMQTKPASDAYRDNYDAIFGKPRVVHAKNPEGCETTEEVLQAANDSAQNS